jgi:hypothetical protein
LHLLKTNRELFAKFGLREGDLDTPQTDSAPISMPTFLADRGWSFVGFEQLLNGLDFLRMMAASRLSVAGSSGGKASLHLGEKEILDQKVNCGERSEDYATMTAPQSKASLQLIGPPGFMTPAQASRDVSWPRGLHPPFESLSSLLRAL